MLIPKIAGMSTAEKNEFYIWVNECVGLPMGEIRDLPGEQQDLLYENYQDSMQLDIDGSG